MFPISTWIPRNCRILIQFCPCHCLRRKSVLRWSLFCLSSFGDTLDPYLIPLGRYIDSRDRWVAELLCNTVDGSVKVRFTSIILIINLIQAFPLKFLYDKRNGLCVYCLSIVLINASFSLSIGTALYKDQIAWGRPIKSHCWLILIWVKLGSIILRCSVSERIIIFFW